ASRCTTACARGIGRSRASLEPPVTLKPSLSSTPVRHDSQPTASGRGWRPPRRPLIGFVAVSSDVWLVGTITSGGTDVIEMPASTSSSTTAARLEGVVAGGTGVVGASVGVVVGSGGVVVVGAIVVRECDATDDVVDAGTLAEVGAAAGVVAPELHEAATSTTAARRMACMRPEHRLDGVQQFGSRASRDDSRSTPPPAGP